MSALAGAFFADGVDMAGKVAVVTGAASGIGLEFARRCCAVYAMHVVMADVDADELSARAKELTLAGPGTATAVPTDVRRRAEVATLLSLAKSATISGCIDVVLLNAGVLGAGINVLKGSEADWRWALDVNLFGVLHGLQLFVPVVAEQKRPCLVAVTASTQGLDIGGPPGSTASYATSKHGLLAIMEALEGELAFKKLNKQIQLSVMCPGLVASRIWDVGKSESQRESATRREIAAKSSQRKFFETLGTSPSDTIDEFLLGVARRRFICDSVKGQAQEAFARRASYIADGVLPSDRRSSL